MVAAGGARRARGGNGGRWAERGEACWGGEGAAGFAGGVAVGEMVGGRDSAPGGPPPRDAPLRDLYDAGWYQTDARRASMLHGPGEVA